MGRSVLWCWCILWAGVSYEPERLMVLVRLMGRCVMWAGASYGPKRLMVLVRLMGREIRYITEDH